MAWEKEKPALYRDQGGKCIGCQKKLDLEQLTIDHKRPRSKGGGNNYGNLILLCTSCNSKKGVLSFKKFMSIVSIRKKTKVTPLEAAAERDRKSMSRGSRKESTVEEAARQSLRSFKKW